MSLDIHIGFTERAASTTDPVLSLDEKIHEAIFIRNKEIFMKTNLALFCNLLDFHRLPSPYEIKFSNFMELKNEIHTLRTHINEFSLTEKEKNEFISFLYLLSEIIDRGEDQNIYFAFD